MKNNQQFPLIAAEGIQKSYQQHVILKKVNLEVISGTLTAILGKSGAGKSTLLHILATIDKPDSGSLHIAGIDLLACSNQALADFRNKTVGFVFQFHNLLPEFTALENVCLPGYIGKFDVKNVKQRARELLTLLGLSNKENALPNTLSGGEQQRVAIARALINQPRVIFADEPSGNLDHENAELLHQLFLDLKKELNQTFVIATHNENLAKIADQKYYLENGNLLRTS